MKIAYLIIVLVAAITVIEGIFLRIMIKNYRKQELKVRMLEEIIEERFMEHGKSFDSR